MLTGVSDTVLRVSTRIIPIRRPLMRHLSRQASELMEVGDEHAWPFRVLGRAPMFEKEIYTGNWWIVPAHLDNSRIPPEVWPRVQQRIATILGAGIRPKGFVIAHEVPKMLTAPKTQESPTPWWRRLLLQFSMRPLYLGFAAIALVVVGPFLLQLLLALLVKLALAAVAILAIPAALLGLGAVAAADPILVAVTEDNYWIEIDRWE